MDLNDLDIRAYCTMQLRHPVTGEGLTNDDKPIEIDLYGSDSPVYRDAVSKRANRRLNARGKKATYEDLQREGRELVVACVHDVRNLIQGGQPVTKHDLPALFEERNWIYQQCDTFIHERANFLD